MLKGQLVLSGNYKEKAVTSVETDNWSIEYVAGSIDFELYRRKMMPNDKNSVAIIKLVFNDIMDASKLEKFLEIQLDPVVNSAMIEAGNDLSEFIESDGLITPSSWNIHLRKHRPPNP